MTCVDGLQTCLSFKHWRIHSKSLLRRWDTVFLGSSKSHRLYELTVLPLLHYCYTIVSEICSHDPHRALQTLIKVLQMQVHWYILADYSWLLYKIISIFIFPLSLLLLMPCPVSIYSLFRPGQVGSQLIIPACM